ncbi:MAG: ROK family protein, partial [Candidatus Rokuibacteriota bacterium]
MTIPTDPIIGVDVGASTISAGLVCPDGTVLATAQAPTQGGGAVVATILSLIDRALASAEERGLRVSGIGVGLPGLVDVEKGFMRSMPFAWLTDLGDVPLAALIRERSGLPVFVDNDVNALALAEWTFGLGRGASSLVTVAIGTGMGAGLILDGRLVRGHLHGAGEIGHLAVGLTGPACVCGGVGCLATYVAGGMIAERARERLNRYPDSAVLARAGGDPERINAV